MAKRLSAKDIERIRSKRTTTAQQAQGGLEKAVQKTEQYNPITEAKWGRNWIHMGFGFGIGAIEGVIMRSIGYAPQWYETLCSAILYGGLWGYLSKPYFEFLNELSVQKKGRPTKIQVAERFLTNYYEVAPGSMTGIGAVIYVGYYIADLAMKL